MKLDKFISNVLNDIDNGMNSAKELTNRDYYVQTSDKAGVSFDIAVTTANSTDSKIEGHAKAGFIEVLGAGVGANINDKNENSEISRIQFTVHVPSYTIDEDQKYSQKINSAQDIG